MLEHSDWFCSNLTFLCRFKNRCDRTTIQDIELFLIRGCGIIQKKY